MHEGGSVYGKAFDFLGRSANLLLSVIHGQHISRKPNRGQKIPYLVTYPRTENLGIHVAKDDLTSTHIRLPLENSARRFPPGTVETTPYAYSTHVRIRSTHRLNIGNALAREHGFEPHDLGGSVGSCKRSVTSPPANP